MMIAKFLLAVSCMAVCESVPAEIKVPRLIADNMVLQRDADLKLWGWASPGERIDIKFRGKLFRVRTSSNGNWSVMLPPQKAGGPDVLKLSGSNVITISNVLVGDVWLASGQSNMEWPLIDTVAGPKEMQGAARSQLRFFVVPNEMAPEPKQDLQNGRWLVSTPQAVASVSAVAFGFARELNERYKIPIGIIQSDFGGSVAEAWMSEEALRSFPEFSDDISKYRAMWSEDGEEFTRYLSQLRVWEDDHLLADRGVTPHGVANWADPSLDIKDWLIADRPPNNLLLRRAFAGFAGTVWLRKEVTLDKSQVAEASLHLGKLWNEDETYVNGLIVGLTSDYSKERVYRIPPGYLCEGRNIIAVRMKGYYRYRKPPQVGHIGFFEQESALFLDLQSGRVPLNGSWLYKPGPDLSARPLPPGGLDRLGNPGASSAPSVLYNAMIAPLLNYRIMGAIWYQGESNTDRSAQYRRLFPALIRDWRHAWNAQFPFLFVQLAGYGENLPEPSNYDWAELRSAQEESLSLPLTAMATAIDLGDVNDVHPRNKHELARRLALAAMKIAYRETAVVHSGPTVKLIERDKGGVRVVFGNIGSGLRTDNRYGYVTGFSITGSDGSSHWAKGTIDGDAVFVSNDLVREPVAVQYNWSNTPDGSLYNAERLPALPFRVGLEATSAND